LPGVEEGTGLGEENEERGGRESITISGREREGE